MFSSGTPKFSSLCYPKGVLLWAIVALLKLTGGNCLFSLHEFDSSCISRYGFGPALALFVGQGMKKLLVFVDFIGFMEHDFLYFVKIDGINEMLFDLRNGVYKNDPLRVGYVVVPACF